MLEHKTLYGDILVFKRKNDCCTITKNNVGKIGISSIEIDGEPLDIKECNYNWFAHPKNTFRLSEIQPFIDTYDKIITPWQ
jgi:hypothetical protein